MTYERNKQLDDELAKMTEAELDKLLLTLTKDAASTTPAITPSGYIVGRDTPAGKAYTKWALQLLNERDDLSMSAISFLHQLAWGGKSYTVDNVNQLRLYGVQYPVPYSTGSNRDFAIQDYMRGYTTWKQMKAGVVVDSQWRRNTLKQGVSDRLSSTS